jgi:hypothetical protein
MHSLPDAQDQRAGPPTTCIMSLLDHAFYILTPRGLGVSGSFLLQTLRSVLALVPPSVAQRQVQVQIVERTTGRPRGHAEGGADPDETRAPR